MTLEGTDVPRSPAWWFKLLATQLQDRRNGRCGGKTWTRTLGKPQRVRPGLDLLADHRAGDPPLLGCADGWREGFRETARLGRLNVAALIVESKVNRMQLRGFRTAAADDELGDVEALKIMRANDLAVRSREVHDGMLTFADAYAMGTPQGDGKMPIVTFEDPRECITAHDPSTGKTLAALKLYRDDWDARDVGHLFIRDDDGRVSHRVATKTGSTSIGPHRFTMSRSWEWGKPSENSEDDVEYVPHNQMPIVRFRNRDGVGEFERHLDTLDRINDQILNKLVIAKIQAFRQRAIKGLPSTERKIVDGRAQEVEIDYSDAFIAGPGELWTVPADVDFWESSPVDLNPLLKSIKDDLENLAAVTSTPLHTITPDAAAGSAEGASLMRESHVYAVESCRTQADRSWADLVAMCFAFMNDKERSDATMIEPIWGPVERYSLAEKAAAASQAGTSLPLEAIQRDVWQYDPVEIQNLRAMRGRDFLTARPQTQLPPTPQPPNPLTLGQFANETPDGADAAAAL